MTTCEKITELKLKLYLEIQRDIKKHGFNNIVRVTKMNNKTLSTINNNKQVKIETLIKVKNYIDEYMV